MTRRTTIALALVVSALLLATAACGGDDEPAAGGTTTEAVTEGTTTSASGGESSGALEGEVGPSYTIHVSQNGGGGWRGVADVEEVKAGTYTLKVEDKSTMHNFHLIGPGVDEEVTGVDFVGEKTVTVTLEPGTYTYQCDPHADPVLEDPDGMKGTFTAS